MLLLKKKKSSITAWLIFLLSVECFSYLKQMKGPQSVERRESRKHKYKGRYFAPLALLCPGVPLPASAAFTSDPGLCAVLSQEGTIYPLHPPLQWTSLLLCPCWMPADFVLRWTMTQFTCYIQQSQLHHFKLSFIVSFLFFRLTDEVYCSYK